MRTLTHHVSQHLVKPGGIFHGERGWGWIGKRHDRRVESRIRWYIGKRRGKSRRGRRGGFRDPIPIQWGRGEMLKRPFDRVDCTLEARFLSLSVFNHWRRRGRHFRNVRQDSGREIRVEELDRLANLVRFELFCLGSRPKCGLVVSPLRAAGFQAGWSKYQIYCPGFSLVLSPF